MDRVQTDGRSTSISLSGATTMQLMPHAYPFVLLDRVRSCDAEAGVGISIKNITLTDPVLSGHFPGFPIYPGVLIIEAMAQNAGMVANVRDLFRHYGSYEALMQRFELGTAEAGSIAKKYFLADSRVKHMQAVYPGDTLVLDARLTMERSGMLVFKVSAAVDGHDVARGQMTMASALTPDLPTLTPADRRA